MLLLACLVAGLWMQDGLADDSPPPHATYSWVYSNPRFVPDGGDGMDDPLDYVHMGMLAQLPSGELAAAWQGSQQFYEGGNEQGLYLSLSTDGLQRWTKPELVTQPIGKTPYWAPVLHVEGSRTWLFYAQSRPECWVQAEGYTHWSCGGDISMTYSDDSGTTWAHPKIIYAYEEDGGIGKMIANKLALGASGEWLLPFWREMGGANCTQSPHQHGKAGVLISYDKGQTWKVVEVPLGESSPSTWLIEAAIAQYGFLHTERKGFLQVFRTSLGSIYISNSLDGHVWSPAKPTTLPNPNSKVDTASLPDGSVLLAYNNNSTARTALTVARTWDGGHSWKNVIVLETDPEGSFGYPTILFEPTTDVAKVIYTVNYPNATDSSPGNAWGWDDYGLRLATIENVSNLLPGDGNS